MTDDRTRTPFVPGDPGDPREIARRIDLLEQKLGRRGLLGAMAAGGLVGAGLRGAPAARAAARQDDAALPDDAAPLAEQVYVLPADPTLDLTPDFYESVYQRTSEAAFDIFSDPLVRLSRDFEIIPGAALEWSGNEEGTVWTFQIDPNLMWNDGTPVTANDWVATFRHGADPAHDWDFTWFFQGILQGWDEAIDPESGVSVDEIGVRAEGDHTLVFETQVAAPFLPAMLLYSNPLSATALEEVGPLYNSNPETSVSAGPFMLEEWQLDQRIVFVANPDYTGTLQVPVQRVVIKLAAPNTWFAMYQNDEIDYMQKPAPAELQIAQAEFPEQVYSSVGDFRTFYLFFDVTQAPFDDLRVRQAFSHAVDRDAITTQILGPAGAPAYSWLAPGFPASNSEGLSDIQGFDPERATQLMAEAGFEGGAGFPALTLQVRNPVPINQSVSQAVAAGIAATLGIPIEVQNQDQATFMAALTAKPTEVLFGFVDYGMDFLDPFNMLSVWLSGGRHSWVSDEFDALVRDAASFTGAVEERTTMFQDAERVLVEDVPAVFIYHETPVQLVKPWVRGAVLEPDANGITSVHWPGYSAMSTVPAELYIGADAPAGRGDA